jgi:PEP-CTERM motif
MESRILRLLAFALIGVRRREILISALLISLFALPAAGDELQITLTGSTELTSAPMPYVVSFDINTLSGTQTLSYFPPGQLFQIVASDLLVTNFSSTLDGMPFISLPSASGRVAAQYEFGTFEPGLTVNNVFGWDFFSPNAIYGTGDPVATLILGHHGPGFLGTLGDNEINVQTVNIVDISPSSVPEPATLSLLGLGLAGVGFMRRRKKN